LNNKSFDTEEDKYNFIIVDVNSGERCLCPPEGFRDQSYTEKMYDSLKSDKGMALINVIAYNEEQFESVVLEYKKKFDIILKIECESLRNSILICVKSDKDKELSGEKMLADFRSKYGNWKKRFDKEEFEDYEVGCLL